MVFRGPVSTAGTKQRFAVLCPSPCSPQSPSLDFRSPVWKLWIWTLAHGPPALRRMLPQKTTLDCPSDRDQSPHPKGKRPGGFSMLPPPPGTVLPLWSLALASQGAPKWRPDRSAWMASPGGLQGGACLPSPGGCPSQGVRLQLHAAGRAAALSGALLGETNTAVFIPEITHPDNLLTRGNASQLGSQGELCRVS